MLCSNTKGFLILNDKCNALHLRCLRASWIQWIPYGQIGLARPQSSASDQIAFFMQKIGFRKSTIAVYLKVTIINLQLYDKIVLPSLFHNNLEKYSHLCYIEWRHLYNPDLTEKGRKPAGISKLCLVPSHGFLHPWKFILLQNESSQVLLKSQMMIYLELTFTIFLRNADVRKHLVSMQDFWIAFEAKSLCKNFRSLTVSLSKPKWRW